MKWSSLQAERQQVDLSASPLGSQVGSAVNVLEVVSQCSPSSAAQAVSSLKCSLRDTQDSLKSSCACEWPELYRLSDSAHSLKSERSGR